ncbi:MAG: dephospho-CoA kinase [Alphaproteobacteria bacterium RIFCSPLOWO2_01_FULL_40_26]|nr:MAG: dephospho-CoA kinase [Alphaproteobacteria bacterium RIFCSPHIGHO2_02_FULL_40_34]OFW85613.1 MAG: dephospho-CoA kinase [Alphaproteobacteria bacterium RIFCSPHIGHO2_01_FULL_40_8]OFW94225.1 MAG: dephospho-CoA kinase [Alphaproteobacteria bacterium RIFCSPLOWO2_01_FULL_40_26]OFX09794.1 MAG: dephospho-CoA kinase [Alphaproteobacteria bacterium RIFCSPLOWO2_02_FULL_40_19]OFX12265.1 MAG: dephospho-CoA kinase [Alphaproteobacteria bacterium RIFCSPLOWO2_12_FULL_40_11]
MKIIGLTGGVASGKNFVAEIFAQKGAVIFDADKEVHRLLDSDKSTISKVKKIFPESFIKEEIDRKILGKIVFADEKKLKILERIIHPQVRKNYQKFLQDCRKKKTNLVVLNIPLLLETKGYKYDYVVAIIAPKYLCKERFLNRERKKDLCQKISDLEKKFKQIISNQLPDVKRITESDFVLYNNQRLSKLSFSKKVDQIIQKII